MLDQNSEEIKQETTNQYIKGRGAQFNTQNKFLKNQRVKEHAEGIDDKVANHERRKIC